MSLFTALIKTTSLAVTFQSEFDCSNVAIIHWVNKTHSHDLTVTLVALVPILAVISDDMLFFVGVVYHIVYYNELIKFSISVILESASSILFCAVSRSFACLVISFWISFIISLVNVNEILSHATKLYGACCNTFGFAVSSATHSSKALTTVKLSLLFDVHFTISLFVQFQSSS